MRDAGCFAIPTDHPFLPGHFPNDPVAPGVMLLEGVLTLAEARAGHAMALRGADAKFPHPARPGETVRVRVLSGPDGSLRFAARVGERMVAHGVLRVA